MTKPKKPRRKMGRPPKDPSEKRKVRRQVNFTEDEYKHLTNSTGKLDVSNSGFMRAATLMMLDMIRAGEVDLYRFLELAEGK